MIRFDTKALQADTKGGSWVESNQKTKSKFKPSKSSSEFSETTTMYMSNTSCKKNVDLNREFIYL